MGSFLKSVCEGIYEGLQQQEAYRDQFTMDEIEEFVLSAYRSFVNKTAVLAGTLFIYFFYLFRGRNLSDLLIMALIFWMAWVVSDNHLTKFQKLLEEHKKPNKS